MIHTFQYLHYERSIMVVIAKPNEDFDIHLQSDFLNHDGFLVMCPRNI